jgi:hypothetical protein
MFTSFLLIKTRCRFLHYTTFYTHITFLDIVMLMILTLYFTAILLSPGGSSTVLIYTQTVELYSTHLHTNSTAVLYTFIHKQYINTVQIYTQTVQHYSAHLHTNSTAVLYTFTHKQYINTVQIYTQTVQHYSTHLHTNSTVHIHTQTVQQYGVYLQ